MPPRQAHAHREIPQGSYSTSTSTGTRIAYPVMYAAQGTFIEMVSYRAEGVPPVFAAHNNRGGDIVLGWPIGQRVRVLDIGAGTDLVYEVIEERLAPKRGDIRSLVGMADDLVLQSCFYGTNQMRFVGLAPVATAAPLAEKDR